MSTEPGASRPDIALVALQPPSHPSTGTTPAESCGSGQAESASLERVEAKVDVLGQHQRRFGLLGSYLREPIIRVHPPNFEGAKLVGQDLMPHSTQRVYGPLMYPSRFLIEVKLIRSHLLHQGKCLEEDRVVASAHNRPDPCLIPSAAFTEEPLRQIEEIPCVENHPPPFSQLGCGCPRAATASPRPLRSHPRGQGQPRSRVPAPPP